MVIITSLFMFPLISDLLAAERLPSKVSQALEDKLPKDLMRYTCTGRLLDEVSQALEDKLPKDLIRYTLFPHFSSLGSYFQVTIGRPSVYEYPCDWQDIVSGDHQISFEDCCKHIQNPSNRTKKCSIGQLISIDFRPFSTNLADNHNKHLKSLIEDIYSIDEDEYPNCLYRFVIHCKGIPSLTNFMLISVSGFQRFCHATDSYIFQNMKQCKFQIELVRVPKEYDNTFNVPQKYIQHIDWIYSQKSPLLS